MAGRVYDMRAQLQIGELGVTIAKSALRTKYPNITDLQDDKPQQKRGIDLYVEGLGFIEVKTDTHAPKNFFLELDVGGKPGAVDRSCADYFCILFYKHSVIYLLRRDELQHWLRNNYSRIERDHPGWIKTIMSKNGGLAWSARGILVPVEVLLSAVSGVTIKWEEETLTFSEWGKT